MVNTIKRMGTAADSILEMDESVARMEEIQEAINSTLARLDEILNG